MSNVSYEYIHSCYAENQYNDKEDGIFVKRNKFIKQEDGSEVCVPEFTFHKNIPRDFWITKKVKQNHEYKLETEYLDNLNKHTCLQRDLARQIQYKLGKPYKAGMRLQEVYRSPYVYGCDIDINSVLKIKYAQKWVRDLKSRLKYAVQDTESDMVGNLGMIIFSMSFGKKAYQVVLKDWVNPGDTAEEYKKFIDNELPEIKEREIDLEVEFVNSMAEGIVKMYKKANDWMPDIIGFWNLDYDMTEILGILRDANIDPKDVFCHKSVPKEYRVFDYKRGPLIKRKDDGTSRPLAASEQWHTVFCTAPFYFLDPMSTFRSFRKMKAEPSYGLDALTTKYLGIGKYHIEHELLRGVLTGTGRWHIIMQKHFKKEYCAYGLIDCIRVEEFDEKTNDIGIKLPLVMGNSQFKDFTSNPRKLCDELHTFALEEGQVMSTTSDQMKTELDKKVMGKDLWINIVEATHFDNMGIKLVDDDGFLESRMTIHNFDLDLVSAYPRIGILTGLCRRNTVFEICKIQGIDSFEHRYICVNLTGGYANAITTCRDLYKLDGLADLHKKFAAAHKIPIAEPELSNF